MDISKLYKGGTLWVGRGSNPWGEKEASETPSPKSATDSYNLKQLIGWIVFFYHLSNIST